MSDRVREILDRDASQLYVAVAIDPRAVESCDQLSPGVSEHAFEGGREMMLERAQPCQKRFGGEGCWIKTGSHERLTQAGIVRKRVRGQSHGAQRNACTLQDLATNLHESYRSSVSSAALDKARIDLVVDAVVNRLEGRWLLVGGGLVALWLDGNRTTEDVDLVGMQGTQAERFALMDLADELGLPIEAVNSAADFFVRRIDGWDGMIEVLRAGERATVYRPTTTLFVLLKMARLTERDLADCQLAIDGARASGDPLDEERLASAIDALPPTEDRALLERRERLRLLLPVGKAVGGS